MLALPFDQSPVLVMGTAPDPDKVRFILACPSAVIDPGSHGPQVSRLLEMQGGMRGVVFQQFEVFSGHFLDTFRQTRKESPEASVGAMHSQVLERPLVLLFTGLAQQEIELSSLRIGFDFLVPPLPVLF